jgi:hypothetical protein
MRLTLILFILSLISCSIHAQDKYLILLKDKDGVASDAADYLSSKAIERRIKLSYPLDHFTDLPLKQEYITIIQNNCDSLRYQLRWFNAVTCIANTEQIKRIRSFPFVSDIITLTPPSPSLTQRALVPRLQPRSTKMQRDLAKSR